MLPVMFPLILKRTLRDGGSYWSDITYVETEAQRLMQHPLLSSLNKYFLSVFYLPCTILSAVDAAVNHTEIPALAELELHGEKEN